MTTLFTACADGLTLSEALAQAGVEGGCVLLTAPTAYHIGTVLGGSCMTATQRIDLKGVYEARAFTAQAELRWVEDGHAVLLAEEEHLLPSAFTDRLTPMHTVSTLAARYLMWGQVASPGPGWVTLRSRRIGEVAIPMSSGCPTEAVRLTAREYVVADPVHGNAYVAEERLIGFEPYSAEGVA